MPLESGTYLDDLNENWPLGSDYVDGADNHLRLIKDLLKNTFPALDGAVTVGQARLNDTPVPDGTVMMFFQAAAPTGWTRENTGDASNEWMPVIAKDGASGAGSGGSDSPILNSKVPSHTHPASFTTDSDNANHDHGVDIFTSLDQTGLRFKAISYLTGGNHEYALDLTYPAGTDFKVHAADAPHTHTGSLTTDANGSAANWTPLYYTGILCSKDVVS